MRALLSLLAFSSLPIYAMEDLSSGISRDYRAVALSSQNARTIFKSEKFGNIAFFRTGLHTKPLSIESDIFAAEETPAPQISPNGILVAYVWKKTVSIFPWGHQKKITTIPFKAQPAYLTWGDAYTLFVATHNSFCKCLLNGFGEPVAYEKNSLAALPISEIYGINSATLAYKKSSFEVIVQQETHITAHLFEEPIVICDGQDGRFACINSDKTISVLNQANTEWLKTQTSIAQPSAMGALIEKGSLFIAIASAQNPYIIEIIARYKNSEEELILETPPFDTPITKIVWTHYGSKNIVCVSEDGTIYPIDTSNIFEKSDQS